MFKYIRLLVKQKMVNRNLLILLLGILLISFTQAFDFDNVVNYNSQPEPYGTYEIVNSFGMGASLATAQLIENGCDQEGRYCSSIIPIELKEAGKLIEGRRFYIILDGSGELSNIRWSKLEYLGNISDYRLECHDETINANNSYSIIQVCDNVQSGSHAGWIEFSEEDNFNVGNYQVRLSGEKRPDFEYDWQVKIKGEWTTAWAVWGGVIGVGGVTANVTLISPSNNSIQYSNPVTTSANGTITGGALLVNATLYDNSTGSWAARNTTSTAQASTPFSSTQTAGGSVTKRLGEVVYANRNLSLVNVSKVSGNTATRAELTYLNKTVIDIAAFSGDVATFHVNATLQAGMYYAILLGAGGSAYSISEQNGFGGYPITTTHVTVTSAIDTGFGGGSEGTWTNDTTKIANIVNFYVSENRNQITFSNTYSVGSNIKWNYRFCDTDGACGFSTYNYSFSMDKVAPKIILNYPTSLIDYGGINQTLQLNITTIDNNLDVVWYNYNGTNVTIVGAINNTYNISDIILSTKENVTIYANDTIGNLNTTTFVWDYKVFENSRTFNSSPYETSYETYSINVTANSSLTGVTLDFNGTELPLVNTGSGIWSLSRDIPSSSVGNNTLRYKFTYGSDFYSANSYQNVLPIIFTLCNSTYQTPFINFTFKDENNLTSINATMQTANFDLYIGSGTQKKNYVYTSSTSLSTYQFCSSVNKTIYTIPSITYLAQNYPTRFYTPGTLTLSNSLTNKTLYLLGAADGIYVTFVTVSQSSVAVQNALINIDRNVSNEVVRIASGTTDSAGSYTVWLNPNYEHTIAASKEGYGSNTQSIKPTQSSYSLILNSNENYSYISNVRGLLWAFFPRERINSSVSTNFGFNVSSGYGNIVKCKIQLLDRSKENILATGETLTSNGSFCSVQTSYTPDSSSPQIKGRLLVDIGEGYQILEEDAYWILLSYNTTGMTITDWFNEIQQTPLSYFNGDEQHREYTNVLIFFLIVMIVCGALNLAGWDIQTNGGMVFLVGIMVWIASVPGFLTLAYISPFELVNQYFLAIILTMFMVGYYTRSLT
jgi:hypothetical protein